MEYLILFLLYALFSLAFLARKEGPARALFFLALAAHTALVLVKVFRLVSQGMELAFFVTTLAWGVAVVTVWVLSRPRLKIVVQGAVPLLLGLLLAAAALAGGSLRSLTGVGFNNTLWNIFFAGHLLLIIAAYGAFLVSLFLDGTFLAADRKLKHKQLDSWLLRNLPAFETILKLNVTLTGWGLALYAVGLGFGFLAVIHLKTPVAAVRIAYALVVGLVFAVKAYLLHRPRYRGRISSLAGIIGVLLILVSLFGLNFHLDDIHAFKNPARVATE